jgi:hypothetical protein
MNSVRRASHLLWATLVAPGTLVRGLETGAPLTATAVLLGLLGATTQLVQSMLVAPVLRLDPMAQDAPGGPEAALRSYWVVRGLVCVAAPVGVVLRSAALASVLQASAALLGTAAAWRRLLGLALHLELCFWMESACATVLVGLARPETLEALGAVRMHAGVDLVWRPGSAEARALLAAANAFTAWWGVLLGFGLVRLARLRPAPAAAVALTFWSGLVALRYVLQPR